MICETCSVEGCPAERKRKSSYCSKHAARVARHGSPHVVKRKPVERRIVDGVSEKRCATCAEFKPLTEYHNNKGQPDGRVGTCKPCRLDAIQKRRNDNYDELHRKRQEHWTRNRETARYKRIRVLYGLSREEYDAMVEQQQNRCAICGEHETRTDPRFGTVCWLAVDHDHRTGAVRGLLCDKCNRGIGLLRDDPAVLEVAADYLRRQARAAITRGAS